MNIFKCLLFTLLILTTGSSLSWAEQIPANPLLGYIKCPPIQELTDKMMTSARAVQSSPELEMMPAMMLAPLGYPEYNGISKDHDMTVFFFNNPNFNNAPWVILAKLTPDSPLRETLTTMQWVYQDVGEWTLISDNPQNLTAITDPTYLIEINKMKRYFDVDVKLFSDAMAPYIMMGQMLLGAGIAQHEAQSPTNSTQDLMAIVNAFTSQLNDIESFRLGLTFTPEAIKTAFSIKAKGGTPLYALFSQPSGGSVKLANYMQAETSTFASVAKWSPSHVKTYLDSLWGPMLASVQSPVLQSVLTDLQAIYNMDAEHFNGEMVEVITMAPRNEEIMLTGVGGSYTDEHIKQIYSMLFSNVIPKLLGSLGIDPNHIINYSNAVDGNFNGVILHKATYNFGIDETLNADMNLPVPENQIAYNAVVNGDFVQSNNREALTALINRLQSGIPAKQNLARTLSLPNGTLMRFQFNPGILLDSLFEPVDPDGEPMKDAYAMGDMQPMFGQITNGNGRVSYYLSMPTSTLATLTQIYQDIASQADMILEEPDSNEMMDNDEQFYFEDFQEEPIN